MPPDASRLLEEEIVRLKSLNSRTRTKIQEARSERDILKNINVHLNSKSQHTLAEKQSTLLSLESKEMELSGKVIRLDHLRELIRVRKCTEMIDCKNSVLKTLEMQISRERERAESRVDWHDVEFHEQIVLENYKYVI